MNYPTEQDIAKALRDNATVENGRYRFKGAAFSHDYESAHDIVESCLRLDVVVTDVLTGAQWTLLVRKVAALGERVAALERRGWRSRLTRWAEPRIMR